MGSPARFRLYNLSTCPPFPAPPGGTRLGTEHTSHDGLPPHRSTSHHRVPAPRSPRVSGVLHRWDYGAPSGHGLGLPSGEPSPGPKGCFPTAILSPRSKTRWSCCGASLGRGESARWVAGASCAGCSTSSRHLRAESCPAAPRPHRPRAHLHSKTAESPRVVERRRAERRVGCRRRRPNRLLHHARGCRAA